jgi:hypothetical protein
MVTALLNTLQAGSPATRACGARLPLTLRACLISHAHPILNPCQFYSMHLVTQGELRPRLHVQGSFTELTHCSASSDIPTLKTSNVHAHLP